MQIIVPLIAIGFFLALNFVKAKSVQGAMKLVIYGSRIITIIIALVSLNYYYNYQNERGMTFWGDSIDKIEVNSFVGEWGWIRDGDEGGKTIVFLQNGLFNEQNPNNNTVVEGKWIYDETNKELYLNYPNETNQYKVQGKKGRKIMFVLEDNHFLMRDTEYSIIRRDGQVSSSHSRVESFEEKSIIFIFWIFIVLFFIELLLGVLNLYYILKKKRYYLTGNIFFMKKYLFPINL